MIIHRSSDTLLEIYSLSFLNRNTRLTSVSSEIEQTSEREPPLYIKLILHLDRMSRIYLHNESEV